MAGHCEEYIEFILKNKLEEFLKWFDKSLSQEVRDDIINTFLEYQNRVTKGVPL